MPEDKDALFGRLAVEREYVAQEQLDEAREAQERGAEAMGVRMPMAQILVSKGLITKDQAQDLANAVAVQTGEASIVAGYEVVSKLGQGGMGAVYKARQVETGQYVALKILPPSLASEAMVKRFQREADVTSKLDHEHIVGCVEFGFDKRRKCHFCALEFVEGEDLGKRLKRTGAIPEGEAVGIALQIARALQHAHANGLVHRDVKPENIMITPAGASKLLDLGLARPANMEATRFTQSGMFVGSPYYASPEQALGNRDIDTRADIYSLGATLYHMVTGTPPFAGSTVMEVLQKHVHEKVPWPADVKPELSDGVCRAIARMMAKKPEERHQDPTGLIRDLDALAAGREPEIGLAPLDDSSVAPAVKPRARRPRPAARARREGRAGRQGEASARPRQGPHRAGRGRAASARSQRAHVRARIRGRGRPHRPAQVERRLPLARRPRPETVHGPLPAMTRPRRARHRSRMLRRRMPLRPGRHPRRRPETPRGPATGRSSATGHRSTSWPNGRASTGGCGTAPLRST
ncbi:MAG: serine/threonine-protein kinase [Planctomycetota bacterium]